ncbi:hypothetical protein PR048_022408 [Dryococelus australis]|uniref:Uncharacterized protein n=1 Tax=Dryococelus australis TaxID=614101 RepID=A0ABQ9H104_9NEOP|nr:hypothetical protein PR048_022408 [Dryococelus australis]
MGSSDELHRYFHQQLLYLRTIVACFSAIADYILTPCCESSNISVIDSPNNNYRVMYVVSGDGNQGRWGGQPVRGGQGYKEAPDSLSHTLVQDTNPNRRSEIAVQGRLKLTDTPAMSTTLVTRMLGSSVKTTKRKDAVVSSSAYCHGTGELFGNVFRELLSLRADVALHDVQITGHLYSTDLSSPEALQEVINCFPPRRSKFNPRLGIFTCGNRAGHAVGQRVFSGISHFPRPFILAPLHNPFTNSSTRDAAPLSARCHDACVNTSVLPELYFIEHRVVDKPLAETAESQVLTEVQGRCPEAGSYETSAPPGEKRERKNPGRSNPEENSPRRKYIMRSPLHSSPHAIGRGSLAYPVLAVERECLSSPLLLKNKESWPRSHWGDLTFHACAHAPEIATATDRAWTTSNPPAFSISPGSEGFPKPGVAYLIICAILTPFMLALVHRENSAGTLEHCYSLSEVIMGCQGLNVIFQKRRMGSSLRRSGANEATPKEGPRGTFSEGTVTWGTTRASPCSPGRVNPTSESTCAKSLLPCGEVLQGELVLAQCCTFSVHAAGASNHRATIAKRNVFRPLTSEQRGTHYTGPVASPTGLRYTGGCLRDPREGPQAKVRRATPPRIESCSSRWEAVSLTTAPPRFPRQAGRVIRRPWPKVNGAAYDLAIAMTRETASSRLDAGLLAKALLWQGLKASVYLKLSSIFEADKHEGNKVDTASCIKCAITAQGPVALLDSIVLCTLEPQVFVHWLLPQRVASVTPHLAVLRSLLVSLQVCYWFRVVQGVSNKLRSNYKVNFSARSCAATPNSPCREATMFFTIARCMNDNQHRPPIWVAELVHLGFVDRSVGHNMIRDRTSEPTSRWGDVGDGKQNHQEKSSREPWRTVVELRLQLKNYCSGAAVAEWLDCSSSTKANRVHSSAADQRVFSGISRLPRLLIPELLHTRLTSSSSALQTSMLRPCVSCTTESYQPCPQSDC